MKLTTFAKKDRDTYGAREIEELSIIEELEAWLDRNVKYLLICAACYLLGVVTIMLVKG
ncbi:hypothetical protein K9N50_11340 [bacterium]|nr:hypothetical protein [bacterium]